MNRSLPSRRNPFAESESVEAYDVLIQKRGLRRTLLSVNPGQVGLSDATKATNLGHLEYAHLRITLPRAKELVGSGVLNESEPPSKYYLMRRSNDGYVSATGMFRAAFPWASEAEEQKEVDYVKTEVDELEFGQAANLWISPRRALVLARDYGIDAWVTALLDSTPIAQDPSDTPIASPPTFTMASSKINDADPTPTTKSMRGKRGASHDIRSASPVKHNDPTPSRPKATPRRRGPKPQLNGVKSSDNTKFGSKARHNTKETTPSIADSAADSEDVEEEAASAIAAAAASVAGSKNDTVPAITAADVLNDDSDALKEDTARVTVTSDVTGEGDAETVRTSVRIKMPIDSPEQPLPESPEAALQQAKEILVEAKKLQAAEQQSSRKRKADDIEIENPEEELIEVNNESGAGQDADGNSSITGDDSGEPSAKRTRVMVPAEEFRRQKMQKRALMGLSATIAVGAMIPFVSNLF